MFKKVFSLYSAFCTKPAFYSQSAVCILHSVYILPLVRSLRFTLTGILNLSPFQKNLLTGKRPRPGPLPGGYSHKFRIGVCL